MTALGYEQTRYHLTKRDTYNLGVPTGAVEVYLRWQSGGLSPNENLNRFVPNRVA